MRRDRHLNVSGNRDTPTAARDRWLQGDPETSAAPASQDPHDATRDHALAHPAGGLAAAAVPDVTVGANEVLGSAVEAKAREDLPVEVLQGAGSGLAGR
jgi:hypothetical protein